MTSRTLSAALIALLVAVAPGWGQRVIPRPATAMDPTSAILDAFSSHTVVVVGEDHGNAAEQAFLRSLVADPRFAATVNDIVVESGNAAFQDVMDRFTRGDVVPDAELAQVWMYAAEVFRNPIYEMFFRAVRDANAKLPAERKLRVILGEAPDHLLRDEYAAGLIEREVVARQRRALVIYGNAHVVRRHAMSVEDVPGERSLVRLLELSGRVKTFSIWTHDRSSVVRLQANVTSWSTPSLTLLTGTVLGAADFARYFPVGGFLIENGQPVMRDGRPVMQPPRPGLRMEDQVDALLVL